MKSAALLVCLLCATVVASAQKTTVDSLKRLLSDAKVDSTRNQLIYKISEYYDEYNPDSCIFYANKLLDWGQKHNDLRVTIHGLSERSYARYSKGNFPAALEDCFHLLRLNEVVKDSTLLADNYNTIGDIYKGQQNNVQAIYYYRLCRQMAGVRHQKDVLTYAYINLGYVYAANNNLDSALVYAKLALANGNMVYNGGYNDLILSIFGNIYFKKKEYPLACKYFQKAYALTQRKGSFKKNSCLICTNISQFFYQTGNRDSAIWYARQAIHYAYIVSYPKGVYESAALLSGYYEQQRQTDSAFKYLKLSSATSDSLFNAAKYQEVDVLANTETNRLKDIRDAKIAYKNTLQMYVLVFVLLIFLAVGLLLWRNYRNKARAYNLLQVQKHETERQKTATEDALKDLKTAQAQLIQSEKMASLGQLTAGIAHEIQNPLNFVNNFSEVSVELLEELKEESAAGNKQEVELLVDGLAKNLQKIYHHGKRADAIVKGMLEHSRAGSVQKIAVDMNALAAEYLRIAYVGFQDKYPAFHADIVTRLDKNLPLVNVAPQDIGRVLLNVFNNAFYALYQKKKIAGLHYKPAVTVATFSLTSAGDPSRTGPKHSSGGGWGMLIRDNGVGIPETIKDKIMQPFFTTKPTGEGTGLGLSLSYDIVVKGHGGSINVESKEGEFAEFTITLPGAE